jgi:hypothetical protein
LEATVSHLRANEIEGESKATETVKQTQEDLSGPRSDSAADVRAMTAVGAGAVPSLDAAGARSLQRMAGNAAFTTALQRKEAGDDIDGSSVQSTISGAGKPLDTGMQQKMGAAYGTDFSGVKVHDDAGAQASAASVQARAYTVGNNIVLGSGVDSGSAEGQKTLAHELTHVVQQSAGPVDGTPAAGGVSVSSPSDSFEQEAEHNAERVTSGGFADVASAGVSSSGLQRQAEASVQRQGEQEGDEVEGDEKGDAVQRSAAPNEEAEVESEE